MPDRTAAGSADPTALIREAVSVHTRKIFDSCRDKDCVDDLRVFPTLSSQSYIDSALSLRPRSAELLYIDVSVEPISFNRGYYTVDCTHFYRVTGETFPGGQTLQGLAIFEKRVMLSLPHGAGAACHPRLHRRRLPRAAGPDRHRPTLVRHHRPVQHHPPGAAHPAAGADLRLRAAGEGVPGQRRGRSLRAVQPHPLPRGGVLPARQRGRYRGLSGSGVGGEKQRG